MYQRIDHESKKLESGILTATPMLQELDGTERCRSNKFCKNVPKTRKTQKRRENQ